jgi:hypothetical protein
MNRWINRLAALALVGVVLMVAAEPVSAQGLWYKEVEKDGRIFVFNTLAGFQAWDKSGEIGNKAVTMIGQGPNGETVVAENETAIDMYNFKHDRPGYNRPAPKAVSASMAPPTLLRFGSEGELKFGLNVQAWYIGDDSPYSTSGGGNSTLGNNIGANTFRLRRSEISLYGKVNADWAYQVMFDPAKSITPQTSGTDGKVLQDLAVTYTGFKGYELSLGQKKIVLTEEGIRSATELDFPERTQIVRAYSDRRETGFFFKGDVAEPVTLLASVTNGNPSNVLSDTNDSLNSCGRLDLKFVPGLVFGGSGCYGAVQTSAHLLRKRVGGHARYNGGKYFPLIVEFEYLQGADGQVGLPDLRKNGYYGQALYTIANAIQVGARYDLIDSNVDAQNGENGVKQKNSEIKTWTFGIHWLPLGHDRYKNVSLKADWFKVQQDNRLVNGVLADSYNEFLVAAQIAF